MKLEITRQETVIVTPCEVRVTVAQLRTALGVPDTATVTILEPDPNGEGIVLDDEVFVITFTERKVRRVRGAKA